MCDIFEVSNCIRDTYNPILEASIGYAGVTAVTIIDKLAFGNERQDKRMEGIKEGVLGLTARVSSVEEENCQLREVNRNLEERVGREGERIRSLERTVWTLSGNWTCHNYVFL